MLIWRLRPRKPIVRMSDLVCVFAGCLVNRGGMSFSQWNVDVSGFILGHLASVDGDNKASGADKRFQGERTTTRVGAAVKWR